MKHLKVVTIIIFLLIIGHAYCTTIHWTSSNNPSPINQIITIASTDELIIDPGLEITFTTRGKLNIHGNFSFNGQADNMIIFTTANGYSCWKGIYIESDGYATAYNIMDNVIIENVKYRGAVDVINSSYLKVTNSIIRNNSCDWQFYSISDNPIDCSGINIQNSNSIEVVNNTIHNNSVVWNDTLQYSQKTLALSIMETVDIKADNNRIFENTGKSGAAFFYSCNGDYASENYIRFNSIYHNELHQNYGRGGLSISNSNEDVRSTLEVSNNSIFQNVSSGINSTGGGLYISNYGETEISIKNNSVSNNYAAYGGGVSIEGKASEPFEFKNNDIIQNSAVFGGGLYFNEAAIEGIDNCKFLNNEASLTGGAVYAIYFSVGSQLLEFDNCLFSGNSASNYCGGCYCKGLTLDFWNCSFINNTHESSAIDYGHAIFAEDGYSSFDDAQFLINKCVFWNDDIENDKLFAHQVNHDGSYLINAANNCMFDNTHAPFLPQEEEIKVYYINEGNAIDLGYELPLHWDANTSSDYIMYGFDPLIEREGDPNDINYPNQYIAANSPALNYQSQGFDIGCTHPLTTAIPNTSYHFNAGDIYWCSFPKLDRFGNEDIDAADFLYPHRLDLDFIQTNSIVDNNGTWGNQMIDRFWDTNTQWWHIDSELDDIQSSTGFKIKFTDNIDINTSGLKLYDNYIQHLYPGVENWVGYWKEDRLSIDDAMGWLLREGTPITSIQHDDWSVNITPWGILASAPLDRLAINYGDMVIIQTSADCDLIWENGMIKPDYIYPPTVFFNYEVTRSYVPVYIEKSSSDNPIEYGLFVDGECIGASPVTGDTTEVHAYIDENSTSSEITIEAIYGRSQNPKSLSYTTVDGSSSISFTPGDNFLYLRTNNESEQVPNWSSFDSHNYPNPFNPTTTIAFNLPEESKVTIDVFNLKGQKINQLTDEMLPAGQNTVIWDGLDSNNQNVSSGIYFYKIKTKEKTLTKKITLIK